MIDNGKQAYGTTAYHHLDFQISTAKDRVRKSVRHCRVLPHRLASQVASKYMSSNEPDEPDEPDQRVVDGEQDRYAELNVGGEEFVVYDRENRQAWIQSSVAVTVSDHQ